VASGVPELETEDIVTAKNPILDETRSRILDVLFGEQSPAPFVVRPVELLVDPRLIEERYETSIEPIPRQGGESLHASAQIDRDQAIDFARRVTGHPSPPGKFIYALWEQRGRLCVAIQHENPDRTAHLTPRTLADLRPRANELGKAAGVIRRFVVGGTPSKKSKSDQAKQLRNSVRALRRLVGDGVLLSYLFTGAPLGVPIALPCEDDQVVAWLDAIDSQTLVATSVQTEPALNQFVACLSFIEDLASNRVSIAAGKIGRPKKDWSPQLLCAVIIDVARRSWPHFESSKDDACEKLWVGAGGDPHRENIGGTYEVWRGDWSPAARQTTQHVLQDVENSFSHFLLRGRGNRSWYQSPPNL
jgi:hypothetical protein